MRNVRGMKTRLILETSARVFDRGTTREVILEMTPGQGHTLTVRLKGTRQRLEIGYEAIYHLAAKAEAARVRREKMELKSKRGGRG